MPVSQGLELSAVIVGKPVLRHVVDDTFRRALADEALRNYFARANMTRLRRRMVQFLGMALGGPNEYEGRPMTESHHRLSITNDHCDRFADHLADALAQAGVDGEVLDHVRQLVETLKPSIVTA
jgi:hemoglobin